MSKEKSPDKIEKKDAVHPKYSVMVDTAIKTLADPKGSSLQAIYKYIEANYVVDMKKSSIFIKKCIKAAVERGDLVQPKGKGLSGSFKINLKGEKLNAEKLKVPKIKSLNMHTSTPKKISKKGKATTKSPNKSPVTKMKVNAPKNAHSADATFSLPKPRKTKKARISLPTKPRKSVASLSAKVKKPKKIVSKKVNEPKLSASPGGKLLNTTTSPKPAKVKGAAKSKVKKSPKHEKPPTIQKKVAAKKSPTKHGKKKN